MKIFTDLFLKPLPENYQAKPASVLPICYGNFQFVIFFIITGLCFIATDLPAQQPTPDRPSFFDDINQNQPESNDDNKNQITNNPEDEFVDMGKAFIAQGNFTQAKEALKTALRIAPMKYEIWSLYDEATTGEYIASRRAEKLNPVVERDISPLFEISRVDTYIELDTLYVVGSVRNLSDKLRQKIQITAKIYDNVKKELRKQTGQLKLAKKGLLPNESSLFEIPFKNFPANARVLRVKVSDFE
jgi:tetratricopeptide (TPR) repeat protein